MIRNIRQRKISGFLITTSLIVSLSGANLNYAQADWKQSPKVPAEPAESEPILKQKKPESAMKSAIQFSSPKNFHCGAIIPWNELNTWNGEGGSCGQGLLYTVVGTVPHVKDGIIKAKIVVPEDNNKEWGAFNGEDQEISNHKFKVQYCITTRLSTRPIWMQVYTKDRREYGERCNITIKPK